MTTNKELIDILKSLDQETNNLLPKITTALERLEAENQQLRERLSQALRMIGKEDSK